MTTRESVLEIVQVTKQYRVGSSPVFALRGVSLSVSRGEFLAIAGPSGSGKTTLLNLVGGIEQPSSGAVRLNGVELQHLSGDVLADVRARHTGFVFQSFNLLPVLTALENVEFPLLTHRLSSEQRRRQAQEALDRVGLLSHAAHKPMELSGGQRQRVAIARAIVTRPAIVLADEPTANLDQATGAQILQLMRNLNRALGTTCVFSTHDHNILRLAERLVHLSDGVIVDAP